MEKEVVYFIAYRAWKFNGESPGNFTGRCSVTVKGSIKDMDDIVRIEQIVNEENGNCYDLVCITNWKPFEEKSPI